MEFFLKNSPININNTSGDACHLFLLQKEKKKRKNRKKRKKKRAKTVKKDENNGKENR